MFCYAIERDVGKRGEDSPYKQWLGEGSGGGGGFHGYI